MPAMVTRDIEYKVTFSCGHKRVFKAPAPKKGSTMMCTSCPRDKDVVKVETVGAK